MQSEAPEQQEYSSNAMPSSQNIDLNADAWHALTYLPRQHAPQDVHHPIGSN
jgi:hypothetical protein